MQERQRQLLEERRRQQEQNTQLWDTLGSGRSTPAAVRQPSPAVVQDEDDEDILAAFNKDAPVDAASHFSPPPASAGVSGRSTPALVQPNALARGPTSEAIEEDDDSFGLSTSALGNGHVIAPKPSSNADDDDILGDLAKPVTRIPTTDSRRKEELANVHVLGQRGNSETVAMQDDGLNAGPEDRALAELVDMGFPADTARIALSETGGNIQSAVGWLLQQAHEESRQKARGETPSSRTRTPQVGSRSPQRRQREEGGDTPTWMRDQDGSRPHSAARRREPANGERDPTQVAQELGNKVWKSANSIWKASQKQMARTIAELQQEPSGGDSSQPKWMRDSSADAKPSRTHEREPPAPRSRVAPAGPTDEAAALDAPRENTQKPTQYRTQEPTYPLPPSSDPPHRGRSPAEPLPHRPLPRPKFMQQSAPVSDRRPATKLSRQEVENQTAQAYVSPARRKRPTPQPPPQPTTPKPDEAIDLFGSVKPSSTTKVEPTAFLTKAVPATKPSSTPPPPQKLNAPRRVVPTVSTSVLERSAVHRKTGGEHFKRGDYVAAHESYTAALTGLPADHPIAIIILSNRALTGLKTGDAKVAVSDAERAIQIIGPGHGNAERIELGAGEGEKDMREFYGKAVMRKAEALEHMEKYSDAAFAWRQAIEAGVGGAISLKGRDRCEKAVAPNPATATKSTTQERKPAAKAATRSLGNSQQRPTLSSASSAQAVKKLRAANAEASKEEDEKFALSDSVDAKLTAWKGGKSDNLRALLQSMDIVLWPEAGWKKVGMSDLVMPARVKIVYMKAIGKVHPDKVS